jgi:Niemann-Pick C1 protein
MLKKLSFNVGLFVGSNPCLSIFGSFMFILFCCLGFYNMQFTDDPQALWVPPTSRANIEQNLFKDKFGAFFRINTLWLSPDQLKSKTDPNEDIFKQGYMELLWYLQKAIETETVDVEGSKYMLDDFCYKPITGKGCIVTSPMQYWRDRLNEI